MRYCSDCNKEIPDIIMWLFCGQDDRPLCIDCYKKDIKRVCEVKADKIIKAIDMLNKYEKANVKTEKMLEKMRTGD